jgi:hypothetical protein
MDKKPEQISLKQSVDIVKCLLKLGSSLDFINKTKDSYSGQ